MEPTSIATHVATARKAEFGAFTDDDNLYGIGDHGGGPTRSMLDSGLHWISPTESRRR